MVRRSPPRPSRCVAKEWRSACGVAVSGRLSARAQLAHLALDDRRLQRPAARAAKQQALRIEMVGAEPPVFGDGLVGDGKHRHQPRLAALAGDADDGVALAGKIAGGEPERLGDAQAGAVEQASARRRCARRSTALRQVARRPRRRAWRRWRSAAWAAISAVSARARRRRPRRWRARAARDSAAASARRRARARACARRPRPERRLARKARRSAGRRLADVGKAGRAAEMSRSGTAGTASCRAHRRRA